MNIDVGFIAPLVSLDCKRMVKSDENAHVNSEWVQASVCLFLWMNMRWAYIVRVDNIVCARIGSNTITVVETSCRW